ncbi:MAG: 6-pyruvoyl trahydropterin synthase family protein [Cyclobacteriaceae bacterium]
MNSSVVRITKEFDFEMAHALWNYDGACKNIHGHSYKLMVTLKGHPNNDPTSPKLGMLIDFKELKNLVNNLIIKRFDHALVINENAPHDFIKNEGAKQMFDKIEILPFQPTCEKLISYFALQLMEKLPPNVNLHSLRLYETSNSYAEWYLEDNNF